MCEKEYYDDEYDETDYEKLREHKKWCEKPGCPCRSI